ncbi:hypothetical protein [Streptomyces apricus]|uniref:Uncharacterized protein n=1 Tax=Streptomyces apricus TaxID=1828112 RepID=A0A5B0B1W6_9ACTN|nr:hypothetical protein [Streptomyces apricus]KAA0935372.1 hypothetical protein FGF04_14875 [Streptomyces apricus]
MVVLASTVTGCFARYEACAGEGGRPGDLAAADLFGTYRNPSGSSVTLRADGSFATVAWPADLDEATGPVDRRRGGGRWELGDGGRDDFDVRLAFDEINDYEVGVPGTYGSGFDISGDRADPRLYAWVGDPDDCANMSTFSREPSA